MEIISIISSQLLCDAQELGPTQGPFCIFQLFGAWGTPSTMVCSWFTAMIGAVQSVSVRLGNVCGRMGYAPRRIARGIQPGAYPDDIMEALEVCRRINRALIFLFSAPVLSFCYDRHWIQVFRVCPHINHGNI